MSHSVTLEVVGPRRGTDFVFGAHAFKGGRIHLTGSPEAVLGAAEYLKRTQQAYPVGSDELAAMKELIHGKPEVDKAAERRPSEQVRSGLPEAPKSPPAPEAVVGGGDPAAEAPGPRVRANGPGPGRPPKGAVKAPAAPAGA